MAAPVNVNAPNTQNPFSGATGGALDTQGRFSFGGITTTGVGGSTSTSSSNNDIQSYVAMGVIAFVVVAAAFLLFKR
jgi:hypothetical protein